MTETTTSIQKFDGFGISEDGNTVQIRLDQGGGKVALLTMPAATVQELHAHLTGLLDALIITGKVKAPTQPKGQLARHVTRWEVGGNTFTHGITAVLIDPGLSTEALLVFPDLAALQLADALQQKVFNGLSMDDQRKMLEEVEKATGKKPKLIIPGHRR